LTSTHPLCTKFLKTICFGFLLLELLDLSGNPTALRKVEGGILSGPFLLSFGVFVLRGQLERAADLFNESGEIFGRLGSNGFNIALKSIVRSV
jgi:hypothetical protein